MVLSLNTDITTADIQEVTQFNPDHPVYLLHGDLSNLVIKHETVFPNRFVNGRTALGINLRIMQAVDAKARVVAMKPSEVFDVAAFVAHEKAVAKAANSEVSAVLNNLGRALLAPGKWVKMEVKDLKDLDKAGTARIKADNKAGVRQFAAAFNADGGLEKLGEVIAADLFNDNHDRFDVAAPANGQLKFHEIPLTFLRNVGNVLLSSGKVIGLDSWDPNSDPNSDTRDPLKNLAAQDPNNVWGGYLLVPGGSVTVGGYYITREDFAKGVIADLEAVLGPRSRSFPGLRTKRLVKGATGRLLQGMTNGVLKIRSCLRNMAPTIGLPPMLQDKANALGWNPL
jgi:hypothetical protein